MPEKKEFDFIIIGSGFGGAVTAMRMTQKGYDVLVLEKGSRFQSSDFPKSNWNIKKFLWAPMLKCFGIQQITLLNSVMVLHGAGFGGGSLVYANTLMQPTDEVLNSKEWNFSKTISEKFRQNYVIAKKMLGVTQNKLPGPADQELEKLSHTMKAKETYHLTEVGVNFNSLPNSDPYFSGNGPKRNPCTACGACMIGCRVGAKNTLDKNYLFFAEKWGAKVKTNQHVSRIEPKKDNAGKIVGYSVTARNSLHWFSRAEKFEAKKIVVACGVLGTLKLLFENTFKYKTLPLISQTLGENVRTNGESLCGATSIEKLNDSTSFSRGIAIGSAFHVGSHIKIEPVRYPTGSNAMKLLALPLANELKLGWLTSNSFSIYFFRLANFVFQSFVNFPKYFLAHWVRDWAKNSIILLVMQSTDEKMKILYKRSWKRLFKRGLSNGNSSVPSYIPKAQEATQLLANQIRGLPQNIISEVLLKTPATAHILGGTPIGQNAKDSVISDHFEVHNYPGLFVCDGSVIPVNLGVNPSLTITALAETFSGQFPVKNGFQEIKFGIETNN